jgi:hypothetical protein
MKWVELPRNDGAMPRRTSGRRQAALQSGSERLTPWAAQARAPAGCVRMAQVTLARSKVTSHELAGLTYSIFSRLNMSL